MADSPSPRLRALDWMRGLVMVLMTVDHASGTFNAGRLMTDGLALSQPGTPLPASQFFTRWITRLCAPPFVFLAGSALALSVEKRRAAGESPRAIDRFILARGLLIMALDPLWMSPLFTPGRVLFQVLYAIGGSLLAMIPLRRLDGRWLLGIALALVFRGEALIGLALATGRHSTLPVTLLLTGGQLRPPLVAYPLLPWLAIMMLGWAFGRYLRTAPRVAAERRLLGAGPPPPPLFAAGRGLNGLRDHRLPR